MCFPASATRVVEWCEASARRCNASPQCFNSIARNPCRRPGRTHADGIPRGHMRPQPFLIWRLTCRHGIRLASRSGFVVSVPPVQRLAQEILAQSRCAASPQLQSGGDRLHATRAAKLAGRTVRRVLSRGSLMGYARSDWRAGSWQRLPSRVGPQLVPRTRREERDTHYRDREQPHFAPHAGTEPEPRLHPWLGVRRAHTARTNPGASCDSRWRSVERSLRAPFCASRMVRSGRCRQTGAERRGGTLNGLATGQYTIGVGREAQVGKRRWNAQTLWQPGFGNLPETNVSLVIRQAR